MYFSINTRNRNRISRRGEVLEITSGSDVCVSELGYEKLLIIMLEVCPVSCAGAGIVVVAAAAAVLCCHRFDSIFEPFRFQIERIRLPEICMRPLRW